LTGLDNLHILTILAVLSSGGTPFSSFFVYKWKFGAETHLDATVGALTLSLNRKTMRIDTAR